MKMVFLMFFSTDVEALVEDIRKAEPLITASRKDQVVHLILRLQEKLGQQVNHKFYLFKVRVMQQFPFFVFSHLNTPKLFFSERTFKWMLIWIIIFTGILTHVVYKN